MEKEEKRKTENELKQIMSLIKNDQQTSSADIE